MTNEDYDILFQQIFLGLVTESNLPEILYLFTGAKLFDNVQKGYGVTFSELTIQNPDFKTLELLKTNIYNFSGAKTFQNVREIQALIFDDKGFKRDFKEVKKDAAKIFKKYNTNYLQAEVSHAYSAANAVNEWGAIQATKDALPFLRYQTVEDQRVREEHKSLNGIIKLVDDPFWKTYYPPNGWRCRCTTIQDFEGTVTSNTITEAKIKKAPMDNYFKRNFGAENTIFPTDHPYYDVGKEYEALKKNNFGFKIP